SPLTSPTATRTPPVKPAGKARKLVTSALVRASKTLTSGPPPASAPVAKIGSTAGADRPVPEELGLVVPTVAIVLRVVLAGLSGPVLAVGLLGAATIALGGTMVPLTVYWPTRKP